MAVPLFNVVNSR